MTLHERGVDLMARVTKQDVFDLVFEGLLQTGKDISMAESITKKVIKDVEEKGKDVFKSIDKRVNNA